MSSSSGEEVEIENHVEGTAHGKSFNWHMEDVRNLARQIISKITPEESIAPFNSINIDWNEIGEAVGVDGEHCHRKWTNLCNSVRTYRTMPEIAVDILSQNAKGEIQKLNRSMKQKAATGTDKLSESTVTTATHSKKKKKNVNPDHPKRPKVNGYSVFCGDMTKKLVDSGIKGVPLMLKLSAMWKEVSEKEKAKYNLECARQKEAYLKKVQEYARSHPEDEEIKKILEEETHRMAKNANSKKPVSRMNKEESETTDTFDDTLNSTLDDTMTDAPRTPQKTPKKRHLNDSSQDSSSPKKRKKTKVPKKVWTAEEIYFEKRFEEYKAEHPEIDEDQVRSKIMKRFNKMSEEKIAKYKRKADERNAEIEGS